MTSPYLRKPRRELDDALKERGLDRVSIGMPDSSDRTDLSPQSSGMGESGWFVLGISALLVCGALIAALAMPDPRIATQTDVEKVYDVSPAAGPASSTGNRYKNFIPYLPDPSMPSVPQAGTLKPLD